jgi:hypothetical protein
VTLIGSVVAEYDLLLPEPLPVVPIYPDAVLRRTVCQVCGRLELAQQLKVVNVLGCAGEEATRALTPVANTG